MCQSVWATYTWHACHWDTWEQVEGIPEVATCLVSQGGWSASGFVARGQGKVLEESQRRAQITLRIRSCMPGHRQEEGRETRSLTWALDGHFLPAMEVGDEERG